MTVRNYSVDVAVEMVTDNPGLAINGTVLELLARKPNAFDAFKPHIFKRIIYSCKNLYCLLSFMDDINIIF